MPETKKRISAEAVCAYVWEHADDIARRAFCALASVAQSNADYGWYSMDSQTRAALRHEVGEIINAADVRQRETRERERAEYLRGAA